MVSFVCLFLITGILIRLAFGGFLKEKVISALNDHLDAPLLVKGDIGFSFFQSFPFASVIFNDIELGDTVKGTTQPLLVAKRVAVQFNLLSVLRGDYVIKRIKIEKGRLATVIDEQGKANYFVFKKNENPDDASIRIDHIWLAKVEVWHNDLFNRQTIAMLVDDGTVSGNFSSNRFDTDITAEVLMHTINLQGTEYFKDKPGTLALNLDVDLQAGLYTFKACSLSVSEATFTMAGTVQQLETGYTLDLKLNGSDLGLEELGSLLPNEYYEPLRPLRTEGDLLCSGHIKGTLSQQQNPSVNFNFKIINGTVKHKSSGFIIDNVNLSASYSNGTTHFKWNNSILDVKNASLRYEGEPFLFSFRLSRFDNPHIICDMNGRLHLEMLKPFFGLEQEETLEGIADIRHLRYNGSANTLSYGNVVAANSSGTIGLINVKFKSGSYNIYDLNATIASDGNDVEIERCSMKFGSGSDASITGTWHKAIPTLFTSDQQNRRFQFEIVVRSDRMHYADLPGESSAPSSDETPLLKNLSGKANVQVGQFRYEELLARNISGKVSIDNGLLHFSDAFANVFNGSARGNGTVDNSKSGITILETSFTCSNVDVSRLFKELNNFDQTEFTSENIAGLLSTKGYLKAVWRNGVFSSRELIARADLNIDRGELKRYQPMNALSRFAKVEDLQAIKFSRLSNQLEIRNNVIHIPDMAVASNVMNLELAGTHTLDNVIDYKLKLNLSQMIGNKFRRVSTFDPQAVETDVNGLMNLYIAMRGPASNPTITFDKLMTRQVVQQSIAQEKTDLKNIIREEFLREEFKEKKEQQIKEWDAQDEYELLDLDANAETSR